MAAYVTLNGQFRSRKAFPLKKFIWRSHAKLLGAESNFVR
jgi:hypothetical protein